MSLIDTFLGLFKKAEPQRKEHPLDLACAVLLTEVMQADYELHESENVGVETILEDLFSLPESECLSLMEKALDLAKHSNDLFQFTEVVNKGFDSDQKFRLLQGMWQVAFSDNDLDKYEEHTIRKISDLLYMPHSEFIRAKLAARPQGNA